MLMTPTIPVTLNPTNRERRPGHRRGLAGRAAVAGPVLGMVMAAAFAGGCASSQLNERVEAAMASGSYGVARVRLQKELTDDPADRDYLLTRMRLLLATLADGQPDAAEQIANQTFQLLRTQGLNADRTVASVVLNEGVRIWKGEPFEQALAYSYIAIQKAERGEWDNARAAAQSSLFLLKDFSDNERGQREITTLDLAKRAAEADSSSGSGAGDRFLDKGYTPIKTDFALGYLLNGIANKALGRADEANDNFNEAVRVNGGLEALATTLRGDGYNTVFIVDVGRGPAKVAYGPSNAFARFAARSPGDQRPLYASLVGDPRGAAIPVAEGGSAAAAPLRAAGRDVDRVLAPPAIDVNAMAASHFWNNLEDVRAAKSTIGDLLVAGGAITAGTSDRRDTQLAGAAVLLAGLLLKAGSTADTRHLELLPQRTYVVPLNIAGRDNAVALAIGGESSARIVLPAIDAPEAPDRIQLHYVRVPPGWGGDAFGGGGGWVNVGRVFYANDSYEGDVEGDGLPYILGGSCVRVPSAAAMERYHRVGNLLDLTASDLENLYREEGIALTVEDQIDPKRPGAARRHILEGGDSLVPPRPGSAGYNRLFCQRHPAYTPRSEALKQLRDRLAAGRSSAASKDRHGRDRDVAAQPPSLTRTQI